jgi:DNA-damage-inducible protein J
VFAVAELASLNIKIDRELKKQADALFGEMGINLATAVTIFVRQAVREQAIPFKIIADGDRAIAARAKEALRESRAQAAQNGTANMTMDEIDAEIQAYRREKRGL